MRVGICRLNFGSFFCWLNLEPRVRLHEHIFQLLPLLRSIILEVILSVVKNNFMSCIES
jgi:hypothetical protein